MFDKLNMVIAALSECTSGKFNNELDQEKHGSCPYVGTQYCIAELERDALDVLLWCKEVFGIDESIVEKFNAIPHVNSITPEQLREALSREGNYE